ncbi:hypothetical protein D9M69_549270 [compost metagenome]
MPAALRLKLLGIQATPPERRVVPPKIGAFSIRVTLLPRLVAVTAALQAAAPLPTQMTSVTLSHLMSDSLAPTLGRAAPPPTRSAPAMLPFKIWRRFRSALLFLLMASSLGVRRSV